MDSQTLIIILRLLHVVVGAFWLGAGVTMAFFVLPTVRKTGAAGGQFAAALMQRSGLAAAFAAAGVITILSGAALYGMFYADLTWDSFGPHVVYGIGGLLALIVFVVGALVSGRTARRLAALGKEITAQGSPPTPAQAAARDGLSARITAVTTVNAALLILSAALMAVGRYL